MSHAYTPKDVHIVHQDKHLLVVIKPAWLPTTTPNEGLSLVQLVQRLDKKAPRLHPTSRLDSPVTGLVVFARTRHATEALLEYRRLGQYRRLYVAFAVSAPLESQGIWDNPLGIHPNQPTLRCVVQTHSSAGKPAKTLYAVAKSTPHAHWLHLRPQTGRTHQLRVHAAHAGVPFLGDTAYGGPKRLTLSNGRVVELKRVLLHCAAVSIPSLTDSNQAQSWCAPLPLDMQHVWTQLGGTFSDADVVPKT